MKLNTFTWTVFRLQAAILKTQNLSKVMFTRKKPNVREPNVRFESMSLDSRPGFGQLLEFLSLKCTQYNFFTLSSASLHSYNLMNGIFSHFSTIIDFT